MVNDTDKISNVLVSAIRPHPDVTNPRGPVRDTTDIQPSIKQDGIQNPVWVWASTDDDWPDGYYLIDGERRWVAARMLGIEEIPVIIKEVEDLDDVLRLSMIANQSEDWPDIVLGPAGDVIGGNCLAAYLSVQKGFKRYQIAPWLKCTSDTVGAYVRLYDEIRGLQEKVANGQLAITVYSKIKRAPLEVKEYIAAKRGPVSAGYVTKVLRDWKKIKAEQRVKNPSAEDVADKLGVSRAATSEEMEQTAAFHLSVALVNIQAAKVAGLGPADQLTVLRLERELAKLKEVEHAVV